MKNLAGSGPHAGQNNIQHVHALSAHTLRRIIRTRSSESKRQCNQCKHKPLEGNIKTDRHC